MTASEPNGRGPAGIPSGYQPALDGVRAVAVVLVIFFHLDRSRGLHIVGGGWLGVDIFFVLSGYLITSLLLAEHRRHGRISLKNFYVRRLLRLAPLSVALVVLLVALEAMGVGPRFGLHLTHWGALSIVFYYSNWWNMAHPGQLGSLSHAWSLSIEEQFYFVWPWVVVGVFAVARRRAHTVLLAVTVAGVVTMGWARRALWLSDLQQATTHLDGVLAWRHFFGNSFLRPDALLFGCLLAVALAGRTVPALVRRLLAVAATLAVVVAAVTIHRAPFRPGIPYIAFVPAWGLTVFGAAVTVVIAWLVVAPRSWFARALSLPPLTWTGRRAYGIYLLHPLVLGVVRTRTPIVHGALEGTVFGGSFLLAGLSFRYFETPFLRMKERFSSR